jgi:hypothetical protein
MYAIGRECPGLGVDLLSQTIPYQFTVGHFFGIFWGLMAWSTVFTFALGFIISRRFTLLLLLIIIVFSTILSEGILNHIPTPLQKRPERTCLTSPGFPSGHTESTFTVFIYASLETIFYRDFSILKKIILVILYGIAFIPQGPLRYYIGDHTWIQVGTAIGIGAYLGITYFLFNRFVLQRYLLERIFSWKITKILRIRNDYQPDYHNSVYKGEKVKEDEKSEDKKKPSKWRSLSTGQIMLLNSLIPVISACLGIIGIIFGRLKWYSTDCGPASFQILFDIGVITLFYFLTYCVILVIIYLRLKKNMFLGTFNQGCWYLTTFLWFQTLIYLVCLVYSVSNDSKSTCYYSDLTYIYIFLFSGLQIVMIIYMITIYVVFDLDTLFTSQESKFHNNNN